MNFLRFLGGLCLVLCFASGVQAQIVASQPKFPTLDDVVTLTYDATQGTKGLINLADTVYGHFGLVVQGPTSTAWTRTVGNWGKRDPQTRMTKVGTNLWAITFNPRSYFGNVPANVIGYRIGMVFRNFDGTKEGKSETGGDIFIDLYQSGQNYVRFTTPSTAGGLLYANTGQPILIESNGTANLALTDNGNPISANNAANSLAYIYTPTAAGVHQLIASADFGTGTVYDTLTLTVVGKPITAALPLGLKDGPNYTSPTSATLVIAAPGKKNIFVVGDFNNWKIDTAYYMRRTPDSTRFWLPIKNLQAGKEYIYQYSIDGNTVIGDPLCEKTSDPNDGGISNLIYPGLAKYPSAYAKGIASVLQPGKTPYVWRHPKVTIAKEKMVVYELLLRDFLGRTQDKSFKGLRDTLSYLKRLGITTIELMPVTEFEGNQSWGYNVIFHGAVDKTYGSQDDFKSLVDSIHGQGMQVVMDVVYNHAFGSSPIVNMYPLTSSPYCNAVATHDFNVGTDLNHESVWTRAYIDRCNERWLVDYQVDGFRFDLSKGFTQKNTAGNTGAWGQKDPSRIRNLARIYQVNKGFDPNYFTFLEHFADNSEEIILSDSVGYMLWGNLSGSGSSALKGSSGSDLYGGYFAARGWKNPNLVTYTESHDEERTIYSALSSGVINGAYSTRKIETALNRAKALAVIQLAQPGPKMLWEFQELGYDKSVNTCGNGTVNSNCRTDPKPVLWTYFADPARLSLWKVNQAMMRLRATKPVFSSRNNSLLLNGILQKRVVLRGGVNGDVTAIANLATATSSLVAGFTQTGTWYEFWTGDSITVTSTSQAFNLLPGEVRLYSTQKLGPVEKGLVSSTAPALGTGFKQAYRLLPNPATSRFFVEGPVGKLQASLLTMDGRVVGSQKLDAIQREFDLNALPNGKPSPGLYLLQVVSEKGLAEHLRLMVE